MQKLTTCLWFDGQAEEAAKFYTSIFKNSKIIDEGMDYDEASAEISGQKKGSKMTILFEIEGQRFMGLNGGPMFKFTEAISFMIDCKDQSEVDYYWNKLTADGGEESQCGWLKDKFGVSWQVIPHDMPELISTPGGMKAMLEMKKIDIATLQKASKNN